MGHDDPQFRWRCLHGLSTQVEAIFNGCLIQHQA